MRVSVDAGAFASELRAVVKAQSARVSDAVDAAMKEAADGLKEEMRDQTYPVLGRKVSFAWQGRFYPNKGDSKGPAAFVWTKAPKIIDFFRAERIHTPLGLAFAIPVAPIVKRGGKAMTVQEAESALGQRLQAHKLPSGLIGLFADLVRGRNGRGFRSATKGRLAQGRKPELTLLFVLVRRLRSRKLIDLVGPAQRWGAKVPQIIEQKLGTAS